MLDHIFLTVSDIDRSVAFYEAVRPCRRSRADP